MFMGIAASYCGPSHISTRFSLDPEDDGHGDDVSPLNTGMDCSSDHHSLASDQSFPGFLKDDQSREIRPQAQSDSLDFRPRTFHCSYNPPHLNPASLAYLGYRSIKGLGVAPSCPQAMFSPIIRVYPPPYSRPEKSGSSLDYLHASPFIEHIDVTTVWKGLLLGEAKRLFYLDRAFKDSLEELLAGALQKIHKEFQQADASYHNRDIEGSVTSSLNRQLSFSLRQLISSMKQRLRLCGNPQENSYMMMLLPLFLISCDCLMGFEGDNVGDAAVDICVHYCGPSNCTRLLGPVNEAAWIPDMLSFNDINQIQREGQELIIIPRYCGNAAFTAGITPTNIQFLIESPEPWLVWDKSISGFRGRVPLFSETGRVRRPGKVYRSRLDDQEAMINVLRIEIKALLIADCGSRICLERTIRTRLTFKIVPWFAHDSACAPRDDLVRPFGFYYPECDSLAPSSRSSRSGGKINNESPLSDITFDDSSHYVSSQSSRASSTERLLAAESLRSSQMSPRKRRAASSPKVPPPKKKHRENGNKSPVVGLSDLHHMRLSISDIQEEADECQSRSTASDADSSCSVWTIHSHDNLSPMCGDAHNASGDIDKALEILHLEEDSVGKAPFHEDLLALAARNKSLDSVYAVPITPETSDVEDGSTQQGILTDGQDIHVRNRPFDGNLINEMFQPRRVQEGELSDFKSRVCSDTWNGISQNSATDDDQLYSPISGSRQSSSTMEIIVENPDVDPRIRREQAILWSILYIKEEQSISKEDAMSVDELKDMCAAMKVSAAEEKDREMAKMGFNEVLDDIFIASGSGTDNDIDINETDDDLCPQSNPKAFGGVGSGLGGGQSAVSVE